MAMVSSVSLMILRHFVMILGRASVKHVVSVKIRGQLWKGTRQGFVDQRLLPILYWRIELEDGSTLLVRLRGRAFNCERQIHRWDTVRLISAAMQ